MKQSNITRSGIRPFRSESLDQKTSFCYLWAVSCMTERKMVRNVKMEHCNVELKGKADTYLSVRDPLSLSFEQI